jgi:hypothetical protein
LPRAGKAVIWRRWRPARAADVNGANRRTGPVRGRIERGRLDIGRGRIREVRAAGVSHAIDRTGFDAICIATLKTSNGTNTINIQGYYTEIAELQNNCGPITQVLGVSGGTGAYNGAQGQVTLTHTPVNPDLTPGHQCYHITHDFSFAVSLKNPQNAQ